MIRKAADQLQPGDVWLRGTKPLRVTKVADGKAAGWLAIHAVAPDGRAAVRRLLREASVKIIDPANGQLSAEAAAFVLRPAAPSPPAERSTLSHRVLHLEARVEELTRHVEELHQAIRVGKSYTPGG